MPIDPILAEIHAIKDANALKYKGNIDRMFKHFKARQKASGRRVIQSNKTTPKKLLSEADAR